MGMAPVPRPTTLPELLTPDEVATLAAHNRSSRLRQGGTWYFAGRNARRSAALLSARRAARLVEQGRVPHLGGPRGGT